MLTLASRTLLVIVAILGFSGQSLAQGSRFYQPTPPVIARSDSRPKLDFQMPSSEELARRIKAIQALAKPNTSQDGPAIDFLDRIAVVSLNGFVTSNIAVRLNIRDRNIYCLKFDDSFRRMESRSTWDT
ncbi:hypothetical protein [Planctomycetes bacterium TBK1r]|uniref:Uncharacterized protein n=1 Tax=Stieleria magnilauensis TaxID=2527963 RepID=A0ABX5Y0Y9_9BACT|nr:hypothetical protein TBK1r_62300 [Planctomycetes bacterium TBK1r]